MANSFLRRFRTSLGPVEQAQVVVSTAFVVTLVTILLVRMSGGMYRTPEWLLFGSILTVGVFGFIIVLLTLKYGRLLEEQKQELLALKTLAESVNRAIDLSFLFQNGLETIKQLLDVEFAWIYRIEGTRLSISASRGAERIERPIIDPTRELTEDTLRELRTLQIRKAMAGPRDDGQPGWPYAPIQSWASVPIMMKDQLFGLLVTASDRRDAFTGKQLDLMMAFANQIGVAVENAVLFDRVRKSEERYMDLFEHSPDMYHLVNREGIIVSCNQTEASWLGYRKEELVGQPILRLYPVNYHAQASTLLREIFEQNRQLTGFEERMVKSSGEIIDVSVNTTMVYDEHGVPILTRVAARDITEKKKLEAGIMHAQRIDSIGNLAGGIAHDFNNILTSILGSTAIMRRKMKPSDPWYHFADIIETAAKRGAALTRQLLTFARKGTVHFRPVVVSDILDETLHLFERSIDKSIIIRNQPSAEFSLINGDDGQIQQALLNLLINARDAMPDGGTITIQSQRVHREAPLSGESAPASGGEFIAVGIADTGVGMDAETQQRIFEPFFTTKEQGKGTGLGLSVVYGVVNSHGGFITVDSAPGKGTTITLHFPLLAGHEGFRRPSRQPRLARGEERVLIIDDEPHVGEVISGMLESLGYRTTAVDSGRKALAILRKKERFDVIILDLNMPKMSGKDTFLKIRAIEPKARVLISTGYSDQASDIAALRESADAFIQKPYQLVEISRAIRSVLDR